MREYDNYGRQVSVVAVGDTHVAIRHPSGAVKVAKILEISRDGDGVPVNILLDRIAHEKFGALAGWQAAGCFVTELSRGS